MRGNKVLGASFRLEDFEDFEYISVPMVRTCCMLMTDEELRQQLEARDTIFFVGGDVNLQKVERQVERLGFGELYIVSATQRPQTGATKIKLRPLAAVA
jgi:hypothetical protein